MWNKEAEQELLRITQDLVRLDTSNPPGRERAAAEYIAGLFEKEGIVCRILEKEPGRSNAVAVIPGESEELPVILLSHIDVVPVDQDEWDFDGFGGNIADGVLQGRGTIDTKQLTAMELEALLLILREKKPLKKKVIFIASADEEAGSSLGMKYLTEEYPELFPEACVLSEGGGFIVEQDGRRYRLCACGEKGNLTVHIRVSGDDGQECMENVLKVLKALSTYVSGEIITPVTEQFRNTAGTELTDTTLKNVWEYSTHHGMHITGFDICEDSILEKGCAELKVEFKFIPGVREQEIRELFDALLQGQKAEYFFDEYDSGYLTRLDNSFAELLKEKSEDLDADTSFLPMIALGSTDGRFIKTNVFGYSPMLEDVPFSKVLQMIHSNNECVTIPSLLYGGRVIYETLYSLLLEK